MKKHSNREVYEKRKASATMEPSSSEGGKIRKEKNQEIIDAVKVPEKKSQSSRAKVSSANKAKISDSIGKTLVKKISGKMVLFCGVIVALVILVFALLYSAFGGSGAFTASFTVNSSTATLGKETITMSHVVIEDAGVTMIPVVDAEKILPITVKWKEGNKDAVIKSNGVKIKLTVEKTTVEVNGEEQEWSHAPILDEKTLYVPLAALCKALDYGTAYVESIGKINVFTADKKNQKPTAAFTTDKDTYTIGETVTYSVNASDPDGDAIADYKWSNHQDVFDEEGTFTITLSVMDARGAWSDEVSKEIVVTGAAEEAPVTE